MTSVAAHPAMVGMTPLMQSGKPALVNLFLEQQRKINPAPPLCQALGRL